MASMEVYGKQNSVHYIFLRFLEVVDHYNYHLCLFNHKGRGFCLFNSQEAISEVAVELINILTLKSVLCICKKMRT